MNTASVSRDVKATDASIKRNFYLNPRLETFTLHFSSIITNISWISFVEHKAVPAVSGRRTHPVLPDFFYLLFIIWM